MAKKSVKYPLTLFVLLTVFAVAATLSAQALETISVQIVPPAKTSLYKGDQLTLMANASGGTDGYNYQWSQNNVAVTGATNANFTFNATEVGTFNITCVATDATGIIPDQATSQVVSLTVAPPRAVTPSPTNLVKAVNPLSTADTDESGSQDLVTVWIVAGAVAIIVIVIAAIVLVRQRKPKQTINP